MFDIEAKDRHTLTIHFGYLWEIDQLDISLTEAKQLRDNLIKAIKKVESHESTSYR